jgi:hypothetical protein
MVRRLRSVSLVVTSGLRDRSHRAADKDDNAIVMPPRGGRKKGRPHVLRVAVSAVSGP